MFLACQEKFNANLCTFFYSLPKKDNTFAHLLVRLVYLSCGAGSYTTRSFPPGDILAFIAGIVCQIVALESSFANLHFHNNGAC
jgi:hypothetical protein